MKEEDRNQLIAMLSTDRFGTYQTASTDDAHALRLYTWNVAVSSAFWGALTALEVFLRNAIHEQLISHFGRVDWWNVLGFELVHPQQRQLEAAHDQLRKESQRAGIQC